MSPAAQAANTIVRNPGAELMVPSRDEWFKAAHYDAVNDVYYTFTNGSNSQPVCALPTLTANTANCGSVVGEPVDVGGYPNSPTPYGTLGQGGNVAEWTEDPNGNVRANLGGFYSLREPGEASSRKANEAPLPVTGLRLAREKHSRTR